jgi:hypothetical protein
MRLNIDATDGLRKELMGKCFCWERKMYKYIKHVATYDCKSNLMPILTRTFLVDTKPSSTRDQNMVINLL